MDGLMLPSSERGVRWTIVIGTVLAVAGAVLCMTVNEDFALLGFGAGLVVTLTMTLSGGGNWLVRALFVLAGAVLPSLVPLALHAFLVDSFGTVESCPIVRVDDRLDAKTPEIRYTVACPGGEVELRRVGLPPLVGPNAEVLVLPPLRPMFADEYEPDPHS